MSEDDAQPIGDQIEVASLQLGPASSDKDYMQSVHATIAAAKSRTENSISLILVIAIVSSMPVALLAVCFAPDSSEKFQPIFDRWLTLVGPLAGAAVGFGAKRAEQNG